MEKNASNTDIMELKVGEGPMIPSPMPEPIQIQPTQFEIIHSP